ncbi:MAG: rhomboid family intramembrane serine protease [Halobacteriales archaeon]|nr:rhomboid family intramembrane serine protease [Halobacteriales archaeon]
MADQSVAVERAEPAAAQQGGGRPTLETLGVFGAVFVLQQLGGLVGFGREWFALAAPLGARPWTLVTSVYAHSGLGHLLGNALAFALLGLILERASSRRRFHGFVLATGMIAGIVQVVVSGLVGTPTAVLGASGAVFAMLGYVITANRVTTTLIGRFDIDERTQLAAFVVFAGLLTIMTGTERAALVAHFTGLFIGLLAGRARLLRI